MRVRRDINVLLLVDPSTFMFPIRKYTERVAPISLHTGKKGSLVTGVIVSVIRNKGDGKFHLKDGTMVLVNGEIVYDDEFRWPAEEDYSITPPAKDYNKLQIVQQL